MLETCGTGTRICPPLRFSNLHQVRVGQGVTVNRDCWIGVVSASLNETDVRLVIGDYSAIGMGCTISAAGLIEIGENVLFARNVYISDHGHAFSDISIPIKDQGITSPLPIKIGSNSWLGQNSVVLPGVTIGEHCIVGANSVVRSDIPSFCVAVGAPARIVKKYEQATNSWCKTPSA